MSELLNTLMQDARVWQGHKHRRTTQPAEPTGYQVLDNQLGGIGWPRGALSECLLDTPGIGELHLLLPLMQRLSHSGKTVFWLNPPHTPYAPALAREGVNLDQVVMIHTEEAGDFLWTLEKLPALAGHRAGDGLAGQAGVPGYPAPAIGGGGGQQCVRAVSRAPLRRAEFPGGPAPGAGTRRQPGTEDQHCETPGQLARPALCPGHGTPG